VAGNVVTWSQVTESDLNATSFERKSFGAVVEGRKLAYTLHFTLYKAVACGRRQSHDRKWPYVISGDRKWPGSDVIWPEVTWKLLLKVENWLYCTFHFLQRCSSQEAITWQEMMSRNLSDRKWLGSDVIWPEVTLKWLWKAENWRILYISLSTRL